MIYRVEVGRQAEKEMIKLDKTLARRLRDRMRELAGNPFNPRLSRQLEMNPDRRYSRVGDWRIIYEVDDTAGVINISAIQHRSKVYKKL